METIRPDLVVHAAAQPSHDLAAARPFDDFEVNALGTVNLLEAVRQYAPDAVFCFLSTNKVCLRRRSERVAAEGTAVTVGLQGPRAG